MLYAKWEDPEINIVWGQFQPQNIQHKCFFKRDPRAIQKLQYEHDATVCRKQTGSGRQKNAEGI